MRPTLAMVPDVTPGHTVTQARLGTLAWKNGKVPLNRFVSPSELEHRDDIALYATELDCSQLLPYTGQQRPAQGYWQAVKDAVKQARLFGRMPLIQLTARFGSGPMNRDAYAAWLFHIEHGLRQLVAHFKQWPILWDVTQLLDYGGPLNKQQRIVPQLATLAPKAHFVVPDDSPWLTSRLQRKAATQERHV
jgi:hypothetical protein